MTGTAGKCLCFPQASLINQFIFRSTWFQHFISFQTQQITFLYVHGCPSSLLPHQNTTTVIPCEVFALFKVYYIFKHMQLICYLGMLLVCWWAVTCFVQVTVLYQWKLGHLSVIPLTSTTIPVILSRMFHLHRQTFEAVTSPYSYSQWELYSWLQ